MDIKNIWRPLCARPWAGHDSNIYYYISIVQQHYRYNVTVQSQQSEGSYKLRLRKCITNYIRLRPRCVQCTLYTDSSSFNPDIHLHVHSAECLIKHAGIIIHTILNFWETPGIKPVTSGLTAVYKPAALPPKALAT